MYNDTINKYISQSIPSLILFENLENGKEFSETNTETGIKKWYGMN